MESNNLIHHVGEVPKDKKLIVFDLDGTLAESKMEMDGEMANLMAQLLEAKQVAVIGGGKYSKFQDQFFKNLALSEELCKKLFLFPVNGTAFYRCEGGQWQQIYSRELSDEDKKKIISAFEKTFADLNYRHPAEVYGELIEDRGSQITFSALGQEAPLEEKKKWNRENSELRSRIEESLQRYLPDMEVKIAGLTSIDVTHKGVDKEYGLKQMREILHVPFEEMLFVGDAFYHEGNDEAALKTGVKCFQVRSVDETKRLIEYLIN